MQGGKCKCEISQVWGGVEGLALGWLGTIYRQRTMSRMGYITICPDGPLYAIGNCIFYP